MTAFLYRSMLFVPPADGSKVAHAAQSAADAIILDWEDGTAAGDKTTARRETLDYLIARPVDKPVWVRLNPPEAAPFSEDVDALQRSLPDGLVLPKCGSVSAVLDILPFLNRLDPEQNCRLMPLVECAAGLLAAVEIARSSPRIVAMGFGAEDFSVDLDLLPGPEEIELLFARSAIVTASRAAGIEPIDSPSVDYKDSAAVGISARRARRLGFSGKMAIHPVQITTLNEAFTPSSAEVERARALLAAFESQTNGATGFSGRMVDEAVARRARRLLLRIDE